MLNCVPAVWFRLNPMVSTCFKAMFTSKLDSLISRCPSRISNFSSSICCSHKAYYPDKPGKWERSEIKVKSSLESVTEADVVPSKKKRSRRREMMDYYTLNEHLKSTYFIIPKQFWTVRHSVDLFYLAEEPTAGLTSFYSLLKFFYKISITLKKNASVKLITYCGLVHSGKNYFKVCS